MKPVKPITIPLDGMAVLNVDIKEMVSNVVTAYCAGNSRSAWMAHVSPTDIMFLLNRSMKHPELWFADKVEVKSAIDPKARYNAVPAEISQLIAGLFERPRDIGNLGATLEDALLKQSDLWGYEFVSLPALGYARRRLTIKPDTGLAKDYDGKEPFTKVPSPCSDWNKAIAILCAFADLSRMSERLLPPNETAAAAGHPYKDQPFGAMAAFDEQLKTIWAMGGLYLIQGSILVAHVNRRLNEAATALRMGVDLRSKPALLAREENIQTVYNERIHPLISVICRALTTGTVDTYHGVKDILYCHGRIMPNSDGNADIGEAIITDALEEFGRTQSDRWGDCARVSGSAGPISMGTLSRQILSLGEYHTRWTDIATKLGWSDITMNVGQLEQAAADFILCDGTMYSREPAAGLLGLTPVLSLGNIKVGGHVRRFAADFGLREDGSVGFEYSPMVVDGFQSATGSDQSFERLYMPAGMSMGEGDVDQFRAAHRATDPLIKQVVRHFAKKNTSGYVMQYYDDPSGEAAPGFTPTDWDAFAHGDNEIGVNARLAEGYNGQTELASDARFISKDRFYHRFPVKRAREDEIHLFSLLGVFNRSLKQDGNLWFDNELPGGHSSADLEKIVNAASVAPAGSTAQLPLTSDQVKEG